MNIFHLRVRKIAAALTTPQYRSAAFSARVFPSIEHRPLMRLFRWCSVIDVGANVGQFSLLVSQEHPLANIYAFEPMAEAASTFRSVFQNNPRVRLRQVAVGAEPGVATLNVSRSNDSSSLLEIGAAQVSQFPGTELERTEAVRVCRLDEEGLELESPSLLKIDVQGFEYAALRGAAGVLGRIDYVYCECSFIELYTGQKLAGDVIALLGGEGFEVCGIYNVTYSRGRAIQADFLFRRILSKALLDE